MIDNKNVVILNNGRPRAVAPTKKFFLFACLIAATFLFTTCEKVPDYCSRGNRYDPDHQFCFAGKAHNLCNGKTFNPLTDACENHILGMRCADESFTPLGSPCGGYALSTASVPADGGIITRTPEDTVNYTAGEQVIISAAAADGYKFAGWAGASSSTSNTVTVTMDSNKPLVAMFNPESAPGATEHRLITTAVPQNGGTVNPPNTTTHSAGANVTATAAAAPGYTFSGWLGASTSTSETTVINMNDGKTLVAQFTPIVYTLTVNRTPESGGAVFVNGTALAGAAPQNAGTMIEALARPADGYIFTGWSGAVTSTVNPIKIDITNSNQVLTATFTRNESADPCAVAPQTTPGCPGYNPCLGMTSALPESACCAYNPGHSGCSGTAPAVTYTVTYNINGGIGSTPTAQTVSAGDSITLAGGSGFERSGHTFGGWNVNAAGMGTNYNAGASFTPPASITLYARWNPVVTNPCETNPGSSACCAAQPGHLSCGTEGVIDGGTLTYEGQSYPTIIIDGKRWMAKNLNYRTPNGLSRCYGNTAGDGDNSNCDTYGRLYDWATAMGFESDCNYSTCATEIQTPHHRGICPVGWHIPSDDEWTALTNFVSTDGAGANAGIRLKSAGGWTGSGNGTNNYGFSALPGGYGIGGNFNVAGSYGYWWSATENVAGNAWDRGMASGYSNVFRSANDKTGLFSLACQQDYAAWGSAAPPSRRP